MPNRPDPTLPPGGAEMEGPGAPQRPPPPIPPPPPPPARPPTDERSIGDLLGELANETTTLLKQEADLAKTMLKHEVDLAKTLLKQEVDLAKTLMKQEVALAKTEIRQEVKTAARNAAYIAAGGAVAYAGLIVFLIGLGWLIGQLFGVELMWLGFLLVGVVVAVVGYFLVQKGLSKLQEMDATPERTAETLKNDKQWLKDEINH